jgi:hypothetical protein
MMIFLELSLLLNAVLILLVISTGVVDRVLKGDV